MIFNPHSELAGQHAYLSASKSHWVNYDDDKFDRVFTTAMAARRGTELHAFASEAIRLRVKLGRSPKTLNLYINDAIGFQMVPEQVLYYSDNCFGTVDAISFRKNKLRIHDLKTGVTPTSVRQLEIYAAMFCLEYRVKPAEIETELRIYQTDEVRVYIADPDVLTHYMDRIITLDKRLTLLKMEGL